MTKKKNQITDDITPDITTDTTDEITDDIVEDSSLEDNYQTDSPALKVRFNVSVNQYQKGDVVVFDGQGSFAQGMVDQGLAEVVE